MLHKWLSRQRIRHLSAFSLSMVLLTSVACQPTEEVPTVTFTPLDAREQLIRLSMDLRAQHPTEDELKAIESNPELYGQFVDRYLGSQAFLDRMMEVFNLAFLTRTGDTYYDPEEAGMGEVDRQALARSVGDEPLRLIRHIVEHDLPYSELVKAPYTMTDELLASWWGIDYPEDAVGWQQGQYLDQRPMAGVLSMNTFWQRYPSQGGNANRHRANAISRVLLCDDFLSRPIVLNRTAIDQLMQDPEMAIRDNAGCQSCHSSLDPLAANMFGFFREDRDEESFDEMRTYYPENETAWKGYAGRSPAYFGRPTGNLMELGEAIGEDPRFMQCAVKTVWEGMTHRTATDADWAELEGFRATFELTGQNVRSLVRAIVTSDAYRARKVDGDDSLAERLTTLKMATPSQLANVIEQSTGYRWTFSGQDGLADNARNLAVLAGGIDSRTVKVPAANPSLGLSLIQERLAQAAAHHVVKHDFDPNRTEPAKLITLMGPNGKPGDQPAIFTEQIQEIYLKVTGLPLEAGADEPNDLLTLWNGVYEVTASTEAAWTAVISAVLRDPRIILY